MTVFQSEDGYLTFSIQMNEQNKDASLLSLKDYVGLLNYEEFAGSLINKDGLVTAPELLGSFIETSENKYSIIAGSEFNPIIYRGQNNNYDFLPSAYRYELSSGEERVRHGIDWVKKHEFLELFKTTPYYTRMQKFKVLNCNYEFDLEAVAQSYGYISTYVDITRNLMTAYFFAYTYRDEETGNFKPIEDFEKYSPTLYIGNMATIYSQQPDTFKNLGLQTLLRSKIQDTMSLNLSESQTVKSLFRKYDLPRNKAVSYNIYNMFRGGEVLFPSDYLSRCATQVKNHKTLNEELIEQYCAETSTDRKWLVGEMKNKGYEIITDNWNTPEQGRYLINKEIDELLIPYMNNSVAFRACKKTVPAMANA